jgi:hypothetical protein
MRFYSNSTQQKGGSTAPSSNGNS